MSVTHPDPEKIRRLHQHYFDQSPTDVQNALYDAFPSMCGFSDSTQDKGLFRAIMTLALVSTIPPDGDIANTQTTYVFFPKPYERWVVDEIRESAESIFGRLRAQRRVDAARFVGECFKSLRLGHLVLQVPGSPDRWVSFGFTRRDPVPTWMSDRLLDI